MRDLEQARNLPAMAERDYRALRGMQGPAVLSTEIFGFHVQQAAEKAIKAWLCCPGVTFRYDAFPDLEADIDRAGCIEGVGRLLEHVRQVLKQTDA